MNDDLECFWSLIDFPYPVLSFSAINSWPGNLHQRLIDLDFIRQAETASRVLCPECNDHMEEVVAMKGPDGKIQYYVPCEEVLRAPVSPESLTQWTVHLDGFARVLASLLALKGKCKELVPNSLWRLGRTRWQGASRDVMFARCLHWDATGKVRSEIVSGHKPIVFVPFCLPPDGYWRRKMLPVILLSDFVTMNDNGIEIDELAIWAVINDFKTATSLRCTKTLSEQDLNLMIRRQIKAEKYTELTDAIYIEAYRQCGSLRKAADYLSKRVGKYISKDVVHTAINRSGGFEAARRNENSNSFSRDGKRQSV